jgi:hypothetical protein
MASGCFAGIVTVVVLVALMLPLGFMFKKMTTRFCKAGEVVSCFYNPGRNNRFLGIHNSTQRPLGEWEGLRTDEPTELWDASFITVTCQLVKVDLSNLDADVVCQTAFWGRYAKPPSYRRAQVPENSVLVVEYTEYASARFQDGDNQIATTFSTGLKVDGTGHTGPQECHGSTAYPSMRLQMSISPMVYIQGPQEWQPVPFVALLDGRRPLMFQVKEVNCTPRMEPNAPLMLELTGVLSMDQLSRQLLYAMIVFMWVLVLCTLAATLWWLTETADTSIKTDLLAFSGALLFALPAMRGLWPVAPQGGTGIDVLTIQAQLILLSFCIILQFGKIFILST